jgi:hypothetical protein
MSGSDVQSMLRAKASNSSKLVSIVPNNNLDKTIDSDANKSPADTGLKNTITSETNKSRKSTTKSMIEAMDDAAANQAQQEGSKSIFFKDSAILRFVDPILNQELD